MTKPAEGQQDAVLEFNAIRVWYRSILDNPKNLGTFQKRIEIGGNIYDAEVIVSQDGATKIKVIQAKE